MIKKSLLWLYSAATYLLWTVIIVVGVSVLGLRYFVLPNIQQYKDTIAQEASQAAGQKVTIGDIRASWDGMHPHLDLFNVDLYDLQNRPALTLGHIETSFSWLSLMLGEPRLSRLTIHKPTLTIRRETDGTVYVAGISMSGPSRPEFPNWLLRQAHVDVLEASVLWQDDLRHAPPLALEKLSLRISSPPWESLLGHHHFGLRATPSAGSSQPIDIRGSLYGKDVSQPNTWSGTVYAKLEGTDISAWNRWVSYPFDLRQGFGAAQFWLEFADGQAEEITADVQLSDVVTQFGRQSTETTLRDLSGRLFWKRLAAGQEIRANRLKLASDNGLEMKNGEIRLRSQLIDSKETHDGEVKLDDIGLEQLTAFANTLPVEARTLESLNAVAPRGRLQQLQLSWKSRDAKLEAYAIRGKFNDMGINAYLNLPGFTGFSGTLDANQNGGTLNIDSTQALIDLKNVLREPIPADRLSGQVTWKQRDQRLEVKIGNLAIASPHLTGTVNATYQYAGSGAGQIDLHGKLGKVDGKFARYYYPLVLSPDTLHWLDTSVLAGRGENVDVTLRGNLDEFPWADSKRGLFKITADITDGVIDYADGWPKIEGVNLALLFQGNRMELNASQGRLYGNQIIKTKAVIPVLDAEHPVLEINGELQSPAAEAIRYINNSPVLDAIDRFTEGMQASGNGKLTLGLRIPLDTEGVGSKIKGSYVVANGRLEGDSDFPTLERINGRLDFTESSLRGQNISAQIFGGPAQFGLESGKDGQLRVRAKGKVTESGIQQAFSHPLATRLHGAADWTGEINIRKRQADLSIRSSLEGLSSSLPPPFNKAATDLLPLQIDKQLQGDKQDVLSLALGNIVNAKLLRSEARGGMQIERGEIVFGAPAEIPAQAGVQLKGRIEHLDWEQWQSMMPQGDGNNGQNTPISGASLAFGSLDMFGRRINDLKLNAAAVSDGWRLGLQSQEISGDALWQRSGHGKIVARLKSLVFPGPAPAKLSDPDSPAGKQPQESYPALDVVAENFEVRQKKLGRMELLASYQSGNWGIEKLRISNPDSTLNIDGEWQNWRRNPNTRLNLAWNIEDIGGTLERFGYPDTIKGGSADLSGVIRWPGSPHDFSLASLSGNLLLDAKRGQILKIRPGVGRLLSVVSLQNLPRRLVFDFRDVFSAGFSFDKIGASLRIDKGVMRSDDFLMEGSAAKVAISGETDLDKETQNLHIRVMPSLTDSVSLAALAGGPAVGAAAWVAQKLLRDPLNKLAAYEYDITGTWDNPQEAKSGGGKSSPAPSATPSPLGK